MTITLGCIYNPTYAYIVQDNGDNYVKKFDYKTHEFNAIYI